MGQYDTCTFYTKEGRQAFGVCCVDPPKVSDKPLVVAPVQEDENVILANKDTSISHWPPAYITHPPDHTAPTHPSVAGRIKSLHSSIFFIQENSTQKCTILPIGSWPSNFPTTTKRPIWPPPVPTHSTSGYFPQTTKYPTQWPTTTKFPPFPTTTTRPPNDQFGSGNYCGAKNGNQDQERIVGGHDASPHVKNY